VLHASVEPGAHPWPVHAPRLHWPQASHVSVSVPQFPHASCRVAFGVQTGVLAQEHPPHAHEPVHVAVPYVLHGSVVPVAQVP
jgi:hypothetical protein